MPERHRAERLQQLLIDLVAHLFHDREGLDLRERHAIGPVLHQGGVDVDDVVSRTMSQI